MAAKAYQDEFEAFFNYYFNYKLFNCLCKVLEFEMKTNSFDSLEHPEFNILHIRGKTWFIAIYSIHYLLNDSVLLLLNFVIDLKLFFVIRRDLATKRFNIEQRNSSKSTAGSKSLDDIEKSESNINKMVIYSFLVYLICRVPELVFYLHLLFIENNQLRYFDYYTFCQISLCYLLINLIQYLYMLSYLTNIFFYYKFNKTFRLALRKWLHLKSNTSKFDK